MSKAKLTAKDGYCFWCSKHSSKLTLDHVPPKLLFPLRVHDSLAIVPVCDACNKAWQNDAEYFRDYLLNGPLMGCKHPDLDAIRQKAERARSRRQKINRHSSVFAESPLTVTLQGQGPASNISVLYRHAEVDMYRIGGVIVRTLSAMHGRAQARALRAGIIPQIKPLVPLGYTIVVDEIANELYENATSILAEHGRDDFGGGLLRWTLGTIDESPEYEYLLCFYSKAIFYARIHAVGATSLTSGMFGGRGYKVGNTGDSNKKQMLVVEAISPAAAALLRSRDSS